MPASAPILVEQIHVEVNGSAVAAPVMTALLEADIELSRDVPDMCILRFIDPDASILDNTGTFPLGGELKVSFNDAASTKTTVFFGEITAVEAEFEVGSGTILVIRAYDFSHRLNRHVHVRTFLDQKHSDIVSRLAGEVGLEVQTETTPVTYKYVIQDAQTNYDFIRDLAARNGFEIRMDAKKLIFAKPQTPDTTIGVTWNTELVSFRPRLSLVQQVTEVKVFGWDPLTKREIVGQATTSATAPTIGERKENGMTGVTALKPASPKKVSVYRPVVSTAEAEALAKAILDDVNAQYVEAEGKALGNPKIKSGTKLNITQVGQRFSGGYITTTVRHLYTQTEGYVTLFQIEGPRPRLISDLLSSGSPSVGSSAAEQGKVWSGVYPAIVTNLKDPDKMGRIKVKFPWLGKDHQNVEVESAWARFATTGAGNQRGEVWYPEVGDEVVVAFERGDLNFPYIIGTLWNGRDKLPPDQAEFVGSDGAVTKRALVTRTGHTLVFSDEAGSEKIELFDKTKKNKISIDTPSNTIKIESEGPTQITTKGKTEIKAQQDVMVESTANATVKASGSATVEATGSTTVKGSTVTIQGTGSVEIKGGIVKIN